jgi:hypothetical protein
MTPSQWFGFVILPVVVMALGLITASLFERGVKRRRGAELETEPSRDKYLERAFERLMRSLDTIERRTHDRAREP